MARKTRLFIWSDRMVAAFSHSGAVRIIREHFGSTHGEKVYPVTGTIDVFDEDGNVVGTTRGDDCSAIWPNPTLVQDLQ